MTLFSFVAGGPKPLSPHLIIIVVINYFEGCVCEQVVELELEFKPSDPEFHDLYIMSHFYL